MSQEDEFFEAKDGIHIAGELVEGVQCCILCGGVLSDYRGAAWEQGTPAPAGWTKGAAVTRNGNMTAIGEHEGFDFCNRGD